MQNSIFQEVGHILNTNEHELGRNNIHFQGCVITSVICRMAELTTLALLGYN